METKNTRQSNFELLRIVTMLMVVILHFMGGGGALENTKPYSFNFIFSYFTEALSIVAVNCYVMISGYFMINSQFKLKKLVILWAQVMFYSIGIYIILLVILGIHVPTKTFIKILFPILLKEYWFISGYFALFLLSPFINRCIKAFEKKELEKLIILLFGILVIWGNSIPGTLFVNSGYSLIHFIFLYILAAYIRLHWNIKVNKYIYLLGYFICALTITSLSFIFIKIGRIDYWNIYVLDYSSIGVIIESLCLFLFIREIKIRSIFINKIASLTLGVYLLHEHPVLKKILYTQILHTKNYYNSSLFSIHAVLSIIMIFIVGICFDAIRNKLFDLIVKLNGKYKKKYWIIKDKTNSQ